MKHLLLGVSATLFALAGCAGTGGPMLQADGFGNTVWKEVCAGAAPDSAYLRFLPDGTFAWSRAGLAPGDFQHDGDDRWGVVERTLIVAWDGDARTTQYRRGEAVDVFVGAGSARCDAGMRLTRVE